MYSLCWGEWQLFLCFSSILDINTHIYIGYLPKNCLADTRSKNTRSIHKKATEKKQVTKFQGYLILNRTEETETLPQNDNLQMDRKIL